MAAKGNYQVKKEDSMASIAKSNNKSLDTVKAVNPGVKTVKPGQIINLPNEDEVQFSGSNQTPSVNTGSFLNYFQNQPSLAPIMNLLDKTGIIKQNTPVIPPLATNSVGTNSKVVSSQAGFRTPTTNGFTTPVYPATSYMNPNFGQQNTAYPASNYMNPAYQTAENTQATGVPTGTIKRPTGMFTGDPNDPNTALWRNYWNAAAKDPTKVEMPEAQAPFVMSREQIWEMKAQQRRYQAAGSDGDSEYGNYSGGGSSAADAPYQFQSVKTITWGI